MKLSQALENITSLGFDTAPLIYFVEQNPKYLDLMRAILQSVDMGEIAGYSSVITLTEVLTRPIQLGNRELENEYRELLLNSRNFSLMAITPEIAEQAANIRARYNLRTPDAMQVAAVLASGCQAFLTNDLALKRVTDLHIIVLEDLVL